MNKEDISRNYLLLADKIIEEYQDRHVPYSVQTYYLLVELIANGSLEYFVKSFGQQQLDIRSADQGKQLMNFGKLDNFEIATIELLNDTLS